MYLPSSDLLASRTLGQQRNNKKSSFTCVPVFTTEMIVSLYVLLNSRLFCSGFKNDIQVGFALFHPFDFSTTFCGESQYADIKGYILQIIPKSPLFCIDSVLYDSLWSFF